ncbi:MAG: hypothetical protein JW902_01260 [Syntrophaceae bacterium]|nr:hypothetical protein [Syntrophaceae bacterium]
MNNIPFHQEDSRSEETLRMAESVTRHAVISLGDNIRFLTCGIDTMDTSFYVDWRGAVWEELKRKFDDRKLQAQQTEGILIQNPPVRNHLFFASGKAPNYRYHVQFPEYHCFIAISEMPYNSPNVYVSFSSEAIHQKSSERELIDIVTQDIESFGGRVIFHKISRCDLYADYIIPGGMNDDFVRGHMVGKSHKTNRFMDGERLETFYIGGKESLIQLRIYDKGVQIKGKVDEERWLQQWLIDDPNDVWRIEGQIRRPVLKSFEINTVDDLLNKKADLWRYITEDWFSLRNLDNENTSRRTIHEFWKKVQACTEIFGQDQGSKRRYEKKRASSSQWHMARIANICIPIAAIHDLYDPAACVGKVAKEVMRIIDNGDFVEKVKMKAIYLGIQTPIEDRVNTNELYRQLRAQS